MANRLLSVIIVIICSGMIPFTVSAQKNNGWKAPQTIVDKASKEHPGIIYSESRVPKYTLPDIFTSENGQKILSADQWYNKRRLELVELFMKNVYGRAPETKFVEKFKVVDTDNSTVEGSVKEKKIDITISSAGKELVVHLTLFTPSDKREPVPTFLLIDNWQSEDKAPDWKNGSQFCPVKEILKRGYGIAVYSTNDIDPDNFDGFRNGIHGILDKLPRPDDAWGTIAAWAWGASRCLDYLVTDKDVATDKIAVVGHSRGGKTALWAGATDQRFAMVVGNESGSGGASLARRRFGETVELINTAFPHWFCSNYKKYNNNEDALPVDTHMLLALVAPRFLYLDCADEDLWGDPKGTYLALYGAVPVYNLLGADSEISEVMPPLNKQIISGKIGFHIRSGAHNLLLNDWNCFMDFADRDMK